jgi:hypothetical protein
MRRMGRVIHNLPRFQGRRSHGGNGPCCPNSAGAVRGQLVAPFCDNKRIKAIITNKLSLTYRHMYKYINYYDHVHFMVHLRITQATLIVLLVI